MVSEVQVEDERLVRDMIKEDNRTGRGMAGGMRAGAGMMGARDRWGDTYANSTTKKMIALYDYDPQVQYSREWTTYAT